MPSSSPPPPIIDSARVFEFAHIGPDDANTGRIRLIVDGEELGRVPNLAICKNYCAPGDVLLLFCGDDWSSQGCIGFTTVDEAKLRAERGYPGVSAK